MILTVWVHRIDTDKFPAVPEGWRWCVGVGDDPSIPDRWCNAGWAATKLDAAYVGEMCAATADRAIGAVTGTPAGYRLEVIDHDPCRPEQAPPPQIAVSDTGVPTLVESTDPQE